MKRTTALVLAAILVFLSFMTGCSKKEAAGTQKVEDMSLKIGLMPAVDSAPILLAEKKGYFKDLGLNINIEVYTNASNRQSALQSGELDGAMTDLIALVNNVHNGFDIKLTTSTDGSFPYLIRKGFEEKQDIKVGMMEVSVSNFLSDLYLGNKYKMDKVFIDEIPARLEMVKTGNLDMGSIPEPMASMGQLAGLEKRMYGNKEDITPDGMVFTGKALKDKEKAIQMFHKAFNMAVDDINKDEGPARDILIEKLKLNPQIRDMIALPKYNKARVPDKDYMSKVIEWVEKVQKIKVNVKYDSMIERKFIQ